MDQHLPAKSTVENPHSPTIDTVTQREPSPGHLDPPITLGHDQIRPAVEGRSGIDALCSMVDTYLNELVVREERMRALYVLMGEALGPVAEINDLFAELNRGFRVTARDCIEAGVASGEVRSDLDPEAEAALFVGMLRGVANQWMAERGCFDLDKVRASLKDSVRRHLAARAEASRAG